MFIPRVHMRNSSERTFHPLEPLSRALSVAPARPGSGDPIGGMDPSHGSVKAGWFITLWL